MYLELVAAYAGYSLGLRPLFSLLCVPLPLPMISPVGPFRLSTHPGIGSFQAAVTEIKSKKKYGGGIHHFAVVLRVLF